MKKKCKCPECEKKDQASHRHFCRVCQAYWVHRNAADCVDIDWMGGGYATPCPAHGSVDEEEEG